MIIFDSENIAAFDCDDTLVIWGSKDEKNKILITNPYDKSVSYLKIHKKHVNLLKQYKGRGMKIIVWSAAGFEWASAVVRALQLEEFVDLVMTKPSKLVDDLPVNEIFTVRIYLKDEEE